MDAQPVPPASLGPAAVLVTLAPLLYTYLPRPPLPGAHLLAYPALGASLAFLLLFLLGRRESLDVRVVGILLLLLLLNITIGLSFLINVSELRARAPVELFRVALLAVFLLYGYVVAHLGGEGPVRSGLRIAAYLILIGQLVIAVTQIAGLPAFDMLYSADKSRPFGSLLRATGSMGNPNSFAWIVAQAGIIAFLLDSSRFRYVAPVIAGILVITSGSRTLLLLFPLMVAYAILIGGGDWRDRWRAYLLLAGSIAAGFFAAVYFLALYFPYLGQLRLLFTAGSLGAINSLRARFVGWELVFREFVDGGWSAWIFGLGARRSTTVLDNDFLFVLFKFGALGFVVHLGLVACLAALFYRRRESRIAATGFQYLLFALVFGLVSETLGGWNVPLLLFLLAGMTIALRADVRPAAGMNGPATPA